MKTSLIIFSLLFCTSLFSQTGKLPITLFNATDTSKPLIFYFSGDGGENKFSTSLAETINKSGYTVAVLNSKSYFWEKKTADQVAADINAFLQKQLSVGKNQQVVLAGYSFGADVIPFIVNKFPASLKNNLISLVLLSPSTSTDFEVHWSEMLGLNKKRSMDVVAEINKLGMQKTVIIAAKNENDFPVKDIKLKNFINETLPGGHHFEGNTTEVAETMMKYFK